MRTALRTEDQQLLIRLSNGEKQKELADKGFSYSSVRVALDRIRRQLGCATTEQAVAEAIRRGIID